ncbi:low molecular weight protein-tyrosine-phosphatase [Lonepinella sp. MS14437]|uniref:low molecular weight protein-tyrosine-phosphatase n=1 Tax=unclassified Lonepinella TaxID=2642006 RepID=UPI0036DDCCAF
MFNQILVVCTGNICRSPMSEYLFKRVRPDLHISSAGIAGLTGYPADERAILSMDRLSIDMHAHVARKLNREHLIKADLVLVMDLQQQKYIEQNWPFTKGKVFRLGHWHNMDIADPFQQDQQFFYNTCQLIQDCVDDWVKYL